MRRLLARALRALAEELYHEEPTEGVYLSGDVPEYMLTPLLDAISKAAFERAWPCRSCGKLQAVTRDFVRSTEEPKWVMCGPCSSGGEDYDEAWRRG